MTTEPTAVEALLPMPTAKQRFIDDMREMADFIEQSELDGNARFSSPDIYIFSRDSLEFGRDVHAIGSCKKSADGSYVNATKRIGGMVLQVTTTHEKVCERVKTGEKVIPAKPEITIEAVPEEILPAEPERVVEIFEWKCPDSFLALSKKEIEEGVTDAIT